MLEVYGVDLSEWVEAGRWRALLELILQLPSTSRLSEAEAQDPDIAAEIAAQPESGEEWSPRLTDYGLSEMLMAEIRDEIARLAAIVVKVAGGSPGEVKSFPRPKTEIERAKKRALEAWASTFIEQLGFDASDI